MSWYKTAKLINLDPPKTMNLECMYCGRWATHPESEFANRENATWKKTEDLDVEELTESKLSKKEGPSSGICSYCLKIIREMNARNLPLSEVIIKNLSLEMN